MNELNDDDEGSEESTRCPYCKSVGDCEHLLIRVDCTFQTPMGGPLSDCFSDCWSQICEQAGNDTDFNANIAFSDLIDEVRAYADASNDADYEGAPGLSANVKTFWCSSSERVASSVQEFSSWSRT